MRINRFYKIILGIFLFADPMPGTAQLTACPSNVDFEYGSFMGWECKTGTVAYASGTNILTWLGSVMDPYVHQMIPYSAATDPYGGFPISCPNGSNYSVRLGNGTGGRGAETIIYRYQIPATDTIFSIFFNYAIVLQDPNHLPEEQPRFRARIYNATDKTIINCVNFDFTSSASLPGFVVSSADSSVIYKDWTPVTVNLKDYQGKTIELEFITSDCTRGGHFGYAYIDVNTNCSGVIGGSTICPGATDLTLTAPYGFAAYAWYSDLNYTTLLSTAQTLYVNPIPPVGFEYPIILTPYPGFGCVDTVFAKIMVPQPVTADAGPDRIVCTSKQIQLGGNNEPYLSFQWSPASLVSNPGIANPWTLPNLTGPTTFTLTVTDRVTGCSFADNDGTIVTPESVDTSLSIIGDTLYCLGETTNVKLNVNPSTILQWYQNSSPIPGATNYQYAASPTTTTTYWATVKGTGCIDTTRKVMIRMTPIPVPGFKLDNLVECINTPVKFTNASRISSADTLLFTWRISDGSSHTTKDVVRSFSTPGEYEVILKASTLSECADSISQVIHVIGTCNIYVPTAFTPNNDGKNDLFKPVMHGTIKLHRFSVYDRWGNLVFSTKTPGKGWDGKYNGVAVSTGVYAWLLEYDLSGKTNLLQKGTVMLLQ